MSTLDTGMTLPTPLMRRVVMRLAPLMILMYIANQLDRANVGYAALTMNAELHMSAAQYGLSASLFFLGYILCEVPSNLCMHCFGARIWMTRILLTWGLLSSLTVLFLTSIGSTWRASSWAFLKPAYTRGWSTT
jgi:sugar phosphate permease